MPFAFYVDKEAIDLAKRTSCDLDVFRHGGRDADHLDFRRGSLRHGVEMVVRSG